MARIHVKNTLNSKKVVMFNTTVKSLVLTTSNGDHMWLLEVGTSHIGTDGSVILPKYVNLTTLENLNKEVEVIIGQLCDQIDWEALEEDRSSPYVYSFSPQDGSEVDINTNVAITIKDDVPSSGLDLSNIKVTLNNSIQDFDITNEVSIEGDPYEYKLSWYPQIRVHKRYN